MKDCRLVFWDAKDNFESEKAFPVVEYLSDYQSQIWYIEFLSYWITTDRSNQLHVWSIAEESLLDSIGANIISSPILDIAPIEILKLVAIACQDKTISFWDLSKKEKRLNLPLSNAGVHSLRFFETFQVLVTSGYENAISLWNINAAYLDYAKIGRLVGHSSMVTAIEPIEKTPMLISADDIGDIKMWDVRNLSCIQTLETGSRTAITRIISMYNIARVCYVGSRVSVLEFEESYDIKNKNKGSDSQTLVRVEYNFSTDEIVLCTNKEVRLIDIVDGRIKKVYAGLLSNSEDDITVFRMLHQNKKFILGDQRGNMSIYQYATGELLKQLVSHSDEVTSIKVDYLNRLIVSSSWDASIKIQKEVKDKFKVFRQVDNCFHSKEISLMEVSVYHNLLVAGAAGNNVLYLWDYEYVRLIACVEIEDEAEPTVIQIINGYSILVVCTSVGTVHFFHFARKDMTQITMRNIAVINVNQLSTIELSLDPFNTKTSQAEDTKIVTKLLLDVSYPAEDQPEPEDSYLYLGLNKGTVIKYDLKHLFKDQKINIVPHASTKPNYNAERITTEDFEDSIKHYRLYTFYLKGKAGQSLGTYGFVAKMLAVAKDVRHKLKTPTLNQERSTSFTEKLKPRFDAKKSTLLTPHSKEKHNTSGENTSRGKHEQEVIMAEIDHKFYDLSDQDVRSFQAHKDALNTLAFIANPDKKLLTGSHDSYFRIWDLEGRILASFNVNHPLPVMWNLEVLTEKQAQKKVMYGMKVVEKILRRYDKRLSLVEEKMVDLNPFLTQIDTSTHDEEALVLKFPSLGSKKLTLMRDEYDPRDIQYERVKGMYQNEISGPSLRQMEMEKRLQIAHKTWKVKKDANPEGEGRRGKGHRSYETEENFETRLMHYLLDNQNPAGQGLAGDGAGLTKKLSRKLDVTIALQKKRMMKKNEQSASAVKLPITNSPSNRRKALFPIESGKSSYMLEANKASATESFLEEGSGIIHKRFETINSPLTEDSKSKHLITEPANQSKSIHSHRIAPTWKNKDLSWSREDSKFPQESSKKNNIIPALKILNDSEYFDTRTDSKLLQQESILSHQSKKSATPSRNFLEYATKKNLITTGAQVLSTPLSTGEQTPEHIRRKERRSEFRQILSSLDKQLKKSQVPDASSSYGRGVNLTERSLQGASKERGLPAIKSSRAMKSMANVCNTIKGQPEGVNETPYINLNQDMESFKKNMDQMIEDMKQAAIESIPEKIAKLMDERVRIEDQMDMGAYSDEFYGDGKKQDFMPLDFVFKKIGASENELKKPKSMKSLQNIGGESESLISPRGLMFNKISKSYRNNSEATVPGLQRNQSNVNV